VVVREKVVGVDLQLSIQIATVPFSDLQGGLDFTIVHILMWRSIDCGQMSLLG
jgi:hypothetical protein